MQAICSVSLDAISDNFRFFHDRISPAQIIPVVKANAYGHGALEVTRHLHQNFGVKLFAVATLEEAQELSKECPQISILIFSRIFPHELQDLPLNSILSIGSIEDAKALIDSMHSAIKVHLNVNTGMNRLGLSLEQATELLSSPNSNLDIQGVYSHFSSSDTLDESAFTHQNKIFAQFIDHIRSSGFQGLIHFSNSAGALHENQAAYDGMRLGIGLYGYDTSPAGKYHKSLRPAMEIKAPLIRVEQVKAGETVSYAGKWQASVDTNIGTLRIGYADGYSRALTNLGITSFQGKLYPVVGTVTMDHIMIDLGNDNLQSGSLITVLGGDEESVKIASVARKLKTISYEICCAVSPRVKHEYQ
ncbi:alanine racemase [bacterium]|nr:alanine racemase [bacterium]